MNQIDRIYTRDPQAFADAYLKRLHAVLKGIDLAQIGRFVGTLLEARDSGATVFFIGNGGSAATASHFANDLAIGINDYKRPIRALSLTDNVAVMSAVGNDVGYEEIFTRQLRVLGRKGDILVAISASGNSPNLVHAMAYAGTVGIKTVALTAFDGGKLKAMADESIHVPTDPKEFGPAEDAHLIINHLVGAYLTRLVRSE